MDTQFTAAVPFVTFLLSAPQIALYPTLLNFGPVQVGNSSAAQEVTVTNIGNAPMKVSSIVPGGDYSQTNNCGETISAGASCAISVTFTPTAAGARSGSLALNDNLKSSPQGIALSGAGAAPAASLSPASVTFGSESVGTTSAAQTVTLANTGNMPLEISSIAVSGDFAQTNNCGAGLPVEGSCTIQVTFTPTAGGARTGQLTVTDNAPGSPQSAALAGSGPDFTLAVGGNSSTSATVSPGQTATYTLALSGTQGFDGTVSLACSGAPEYSTCGVTPQSPTLSGTAQTTVTVSVNTTAGSTVTLRTPTPPPAVRVWPLGMVGILLLWLLVFLLVARRRRLARHGPRRGVLRVSGHGGARLAFGTCFMAFALLTMLAMPSCGGGGGGGGGGGTVTTPGTPPGAYTLTLTATAAVGLTPLTHTMTLTLTVN
jgi:hypothetical protein